MAKTKSVNNIKNVNLKTSDIVTKKGFNTVVLNKKRGRPPKKKLIVEDEVKKKNIKEEDVKLVKKSSTKNVIDNEITAKIPIKKINKEITTKIPVKKISTQKPSIEKELTKEEIIAQRKARNKKKYQNQQKKYQESKLKTKNRINTEDKTIDKEQTTTEITSIDLVKEITTEEEINLEPKKKDFVEIDSLKEKRKENRKQSQFAKTLVDFKTKSVDTINIVKEKTTDQNIPLGKTKEEKTTRRKRYIKEAIVYSLMLTIINVFCILFIDYFNFLRLFDVKYLNIIVTVLISLIINFFVAFMVDYFVTDVWLKGKRKKKVGEQNGDSRVNGE